MEKALGLAKKIAPRTHVGNSLTELAYRAFEVSDLAAWKRFATDVMGMRVKSAAATDVRFVKMDSRPWRCSLLQGPTDDITLAGCQGVDNQTLDSYAIDLADLGFSTTWGEPVGLFLRGLERLLRLIGPIGVAHEASVGERAVEPFIPRTSKGGFVTGEAGLGHIAFGPNHDDAEVDFAHKAPGVALSDVIEQPITETMNVDATFLHLNERHHSIAFANRGGGRKLRYVMVDVDRVNGVGKARDRHLRAGLAVAQDIGQHANDKMISYYGVTPSRSSSSTAGAASRLMPPAGVLAPSIA